jgi:hypothetical protein
MTSTADPPNKPPAPKSDQPNQDNLQPGKSYFECARQTGQPWPERSRVLDFTRTRKLKDLHHIILPELFVPIQEVYYGRNKTLRFSSKLSNLISLKLIESIGNMLKSKNGRGLKRYMKRAQKMYRKLTKYRKPSMEPIQLAFNEKRPTRTANIQFPECILELSDLTWSFPDRRIRIAASAAEKMVENAILWIDQKHWVLNSVKHLSCAPKDRLRWDRRDSRKGINILLQHITNGRWIWISSVKPIPRMTYMLAAKNRPEWRESAQIRVLINIASTKALHDARMTFFSFRSNNHGAALHQFCQNEKRVVELKNLVGMLDLLHLSIYLSDPKNATIMENISKRLPIQMEKYWDIQSKNPEELEELIRWNTEPDYRRLLRLFRRPSGPPRARSDPEVLRMANKRLLIEKENPSCRYYMCEFNSCAFEEGKKAAAARKIVVRAIIRRAVLVYAREKACHEISCHPCFWENTSYSCKLHRAKLLKSKKKETPCLRCWMVRMLQEHRKSREIERQDRISPFAEPTVLETTIYWDPEHQSVGAPEGWCCHALEPCRQNCWKEHRSCAGNCKVVRNFYEYGKCINDENEELPIKKVVFRVDSCLRRKLTLIEKLPIVKERPPQLSAEPSQDDNASESKIDSNEESLPQFSAEPIRNHNSSESKIDGNKGSRGFWKTIRRWTRSRRAEHLSQFQAKVQVRLRPLLSQFSSADIFEKQMWPIAVRL